MRGPDVGVVLKEHLSASPQGFIEFAPDLAVGVISPGDSYQDVADRVQLWLGAGCKSVWVVEPKHRTVAMWTRPTQVRHFGPGDTLTSDPALPALVLPVAKLFS